MAKVERYLVYGASGVQGGAVARLLTGQGKQVRTVTRNAETAIALQEQGIEAVVGDFSDLDALAQAHAGVDRVFLNIPVDFELPRVRQHFRHAVDAASKAGIELLVVNTSVFVPEQSTASEAIEIKRELTAYVKESGVPFIVVQPIVYMENLLIPGILNNGVLAYPVPADKPIAWISAEDAAKYHVYALNHPELAGSTLQAPGPEALTGSQLAERFSQALGQSIAFYSLPVDSFEAAIGAMLGEQTASGLGGLYRWLGDHTASLPQPEKREQLADRGIQLTTLPEWLQKGSQQPHRE